MTIQRGHEDIPYWANKAELRRALEHCRRMQKPYFLFYAECCAKCEPRGFVDNIMDGVTAVTMDKTTIGHHADIELERKEQPPMWIDILADDSTSQEKMEYCERHGIDLFQLDGKGHPTQAHVLRAHIANRNCRKEKRDRLEELWNLIRKTNDAAAGVREDFRSEEEKQKDWEDLWKKSAEKRRMAEQGCARCKKQLVADNGSFGISVTPTHKANGRCAEEVALCTECDFQLRGGWKGEYPEDASQWGLMRGCEYCESALIEQEKALKDMQQNQTRSLWMPESYGQRAIYEPRKREQQCVVAGKHVNKDELLSTLAMIKPGRLQSHFMACTC